MDRTRVLIVGAAGRDFHNFNLVYRGREDYEVVGFTATQIPNIEGRVYPAQLAGSLYPDGIPIHPESELEAIVAAGIDEGFYVYSYLRSWAFEAQLRDHLRSRFGTDWFASREAGSLLQELWAEGQRPTADELLHEVTGAKLEMAAVADRVRESLR